MIVRPKRPGPYWASLDDGERVTETALVLVSPISGRDDMSEGGSAAFCDGSYKTFDVVSSGEITDLFRAVPFGYQTATSGLGKFRVTWIGEARPPRSAPKAGDDI